jgi:hypothetical protein
MLYPPTAALRDMSISISLIYYRSQCHRSQLLTASLLRPSPAPPAHPTAGLLKSLRNGRERKRERERERERAKREARERSDRELRESEREERQRELREQRERGATERAERAARERSDRES